MSQTGPPEENSGDRQEPEQEYPLAPQDADTAQEESTVPPLFPTSYHQEPPSEGPFQFSLSEALVLLVVLSLLLGVMRTVPRTWAAFLTGIVVFLSLVLMSLLRLERPIFHLGWWALLVVYVLLCIAAMVAGS